MICSAVQLVRGIWGNGSAHGFQWLVPSLVTSHTYMLVKPMCVITAQHTATAC